ncbi:MAG: extracellular solute-binding protein [Rhodospirillales bacterium]|nr:extracellular solute-binding protein [Rhodospirillales bacterium]MDH3910561.1 extracellular solute-binding protein [Rhodospirillales bacterium]MDH3917687.1 extracellular solute-binding protein [Rhodospirillales bacterium]
MRKITRRDAFKLGAGAAALAASSGLAKPGQAQSLSFTPEKGAKLRVLRWKRFVQGDEDLWMANTRKFTEQTGVEVVTEHESWEDVRPKAAVAANIGSGPDIIVGWYDDPHQYPDKLVDLTDLAEYLGDKYGGWYPVAREYGTRQGRWISLPLGAAGNCIVYRKSWMNEAGFDSFPKDTDGLLRLCQELKKNGHPPGFALGNAVGDGNVWTHWLLWSFGGKMVDSSNQVVINSPETINALEYARELYDTFIPGTVSWLDAHNNKAFLSGQIGLTANGISVYYAAKTQGSAFVDDIHHANMPVGPVGKPTELNLFTQAMLFSHSKHPNAAKEFLRFMWEKEQYEPWQQAAIGYITQPLKAYESNPVWTADPKHTPYRDTVGNMLTNGHAGTLGYSSAAAMADFIVVNMVAEAAAGREAAKDAAARAEKRALRYYKV